MTLYLTLKDIKKLPNESIVYVSGSEAGQLISRKVLNDSKLPITLSRQSVLNLRVYEPGTTTIENDKGFKGETFFSAERFIRENRTNPKLYERNSTFTHEATIFNQKSEEIGALVFQVKCAKGLLYKGQKMAIFEELPENEPVIFYNGPCRNRNLFSFFDSGNSDRPYNTVEKLYRDDTWNL